MYFKRITFFLVGFFLLSAFQNSIAQNIKPPVFQNRSDEKRGKDAMRVMFYNVENLFDPFNDSLKADDEYLPTGMRGWTYSKMKRKQINTAKVILAVGGWEPPDIVGFCEVENRFVLTGLLNDTPLKNFGYKIVHYESPDPRGIDVALIYRPEKFKVLTTMPIPVRFPFDTASRTRDILYVLGIACNKDTLHVFVNHWPSKFGGSMATVPKRNYVGAFLRSKVDSLMLRNPNSKILIMGDLNESPTEECVSKSLNATMDSTNLKAGDLYNLLGGAGISWNRGTIKFREEWETIDHLIITPTLLPQAPGLHVKKMGLTIFDAPFLLQNDDVWFGKKPFRTYYGSKYLGGFSDHLPVYIDLKY